MPMLTLNVFVLVASVALVLLCLAAYLFLSSRRGGNRGGSTFDSGRYDKSAESDDAPLARNRSGGWAEYSPDKRAK